MEAVKVFFNDDHQRSRLDTETPIGLHAASRLGVIYRGDDLLSGQLPFVTALDGVITYIDFCIEAFGSH
ncbi:MAG TPA: hypothetical protein PKZ34_01885 [Thermotogota bacterium]|nr:hypothetical protein [Thermotogota bacterium]